MLSVEIGCHINSAAPNTHSIHNTLILRVSVKERKILAGNVVKGISAVTFGDDPRNSLHKLQHTQKTNSHNSIQ